MKKPHLLAIVASALVIGVGLGVGLTLSLGQDRSVGDTKADDCIVTNGRSIRQTVGPESSARSAVTTDTEGMAGSPESMGLQGEDDLHIVLRSGSPQSACDRLLRARPDSAALGLVSAELAFLAGEVERGKGELTKLARKHPSSVMVGLSLASVLVSMGERQAAEEALSTLQAGHGFSHLESLLEAFRLELAGSLGQAEKTMIQAASSNSALAIERLVAFYGRHARYSDALARIDEFLVAQPCSSEEARRLRFRKGQCLLAMGHLPEAYEVFSGILAKHSSGLARVSDVQYSYMVVRIMAEAFGYELIELPRHLVDSTKTLIAGDERVSSSKTLAVFLGARKPDKALQELTALRRSCPEFPGAAGRRALLTCMFLLKMDAATRGTVSSELVGWQLASFGASTRTPYYFNFVMGWLP